VDGIGDDWDGVTSIIYDADRHTLYAGTGRDIVRVLLAADDTFLYFAIDLADDTPSTTQEFSYGVWVQELAAYDAGQIMSETPMSGLRTMEHRVRAGGVVRRIA
jgi:hypothetical protein